MHVIATAGHVDHGKSTLVRALTGIEPDRLAEERRRGLTVDLGFAWLTTPERRDVAFVDVPGHERFLGNMLAGLGPAPVVCFVVAADEGWRAQSSDHRDAIAALGIRHGLIVISRADRAPDAGERVTQQVRRELASTGLADAPVAVVSAVTGDGMAQLPGLLDRVLAAAPIADTEARVRLWVDREFTVKGAGTVVTGTLASGRIAVGDELEVAGAALETRVSVRGVQQHGSSREEALPVSRVALNLRGTPADAIHRGDVLLTPGAWHRTGTIDVRRVSGGAFRDLSTHMTAHVGTAAIPARLRPFDDDHARLSLDRAIPLAVGDRIVLQDNGSRLIVAGARVLDAEPPALRRRGDATRRAETMARIPEQGDPVVEVARRGAVLPAHLRILGLSVDAAAVPRGVRAVGDWWVDPARFEHWRLRLREVVDDLHRRDPLAGGISRGAAVDLLGLPAAALLDPVADAAGLRRDGGRIRLAADAATLGPAEPALQRLEDELRAHPFAAPESDELVELGLGARELAAAERSGRIVRLSGGIVLLPNAPALAMRELAQLPALFTTSQARQALDATRRVVIPLLEHLDARGWTHRVDNAHREVVRGS